MTGYGGNALGLQRFEVYSVHDERIRMVHAIAARMMAGEAFDDAKAAVIKGHEKAWRAARPALREGFSRVGQDIRLADMPRAVHRKLDDDFLDGIEIAEGRVLSRLSRWCYRTFGFWF